MSENHGCCGHPKSCTNTGRCKAYEDFLEASRPKTERKQPRRSSLFDGIDPQEIAKAREQVKKRRERERAREQRERSRGVYHLGRTR